MMVAMLPNAEYTVVLITVVLVDIISTDVALPPNSSLCDDDQQHQDDDEHYDNSQTPILPSLSRKAIEPSPCAHKLGLVPVHTLLHIVQQHDLAVQLIAYQHAKLPLTPDACAQLVQLVILIAHHLAVVLVDLLVVEMRLIGRLAISRVIAIREEGGAIGVFGRRCGVWAVGEADGFGEVCFLLLLRGGEVGRQGGVVWGCECGGGRRRRRGGAELQC